MNKYIAVGNLVRDPEVKSFANGGEVCNFALAINRRWKDVQTGELKEVAVFPEFSLWGTTVNNFVNLCKKGNKILVEAEYTQNKTGQGEDARTFHSFRVFNWELLTPKNSNGNEQKRVEEKDEDSFDDTPKETPKRGRPVKVKSSVVEDDDSDSIPF